MGRVLAALLLSLLAATPAAAQEERSVLIVLDSSKSMNEPAGNGQTRLDVAKEATKDLLRSVPADARVGLRVYGAKVAEAGRAAGCRDTELVIPVAQVDHAEVESAVDALEGKGRTPIGRSILAAADDLPAGGRRTVILVSDGGDNCAPPDPCRAAEQVSRRGIDMTIQVVGLQVNDRVRRQLECIADAGGGTYVGADDPDQLRAELAAAFARAVRDYEPAGKPVEGGSSSSAAPTVASGQYLDSAPPGQTRWYAIDVKKGQRMFAAATLIAEPPPAPDFYTLVTVTLLDPQGERLVDETDMYRTLNGRAPVGTFTAALENPAPADGRYRFGVTLKEHEAITEPLPMEVIFSAPGGEQQGDPAPQADPGGRAPQVGRSSDVPELAGVGGAGLLLGLLVGFVTRRRQR